MLIGLPEASDTGIHWEQFGIHHLICGCREIPSQMLFIFIPSVQHGWDRERGEAGLDPKSLESLEAAGQQRLEHRGCGWRKEVKVKPGAGETLRIPGEALAAGAAARCGSCCIPLG